MHLQSYVTGSVGGVKTGLKPPHLIYGAPLINNEAQCQHRTSNLVYYIGYYIRFVLQNEKLVYS